MDGTVNTFAARDGNVTFGVPGTIRTPSAQALSVPAVSFEIGLVFFLITIAIWTPMGYLNTAANLLAVTSILWLTARSSFSARELGFTLPAHGTIITLGLGIVFAMAIAAAGTALQPTFGPAHAVPVHRAWQYAIWAVAQEFILQSFFYLRLKSILGHRRATWVAALLFAAVHIPSPVLTALGFVGGLLFCELFRRYRALVPIGLAHALLGLTIAASFPDSLLHHMRVGIGYLIYHYR